MTIVTYWFRIGDSDKKMPQSAKCTHARMHASTRARALAQTHKHTYLTIGNTLPSFPLAHNTSCLFSRSSSISSLMFSPSVASLSPYSPLFFCSSLGANLSSLSSEISTRADRDRGSDSNRKRKRGREGERQIQREREIFERETHTEKRLLVCKRVHACERACL